MKKVEIDMPLNLDDKQLAQIELHSIHNTLTIMSGEIQFIGKVAGSKEAVRPSLSLLSQLLDAITDIRMMEEYIGHWDEHKATIFSNIREAIANAPIKPEHLPLVEASQANLKRILGVVDIRVKELIHRRNNADEWAVLSAGEITARLKHVLDAIALNSQGRYGIVYDVEKQGKNDYLIDISVSGENGRDLRLPPVLLDTFRDLTANARKYTQPGGVIRAELTERSDGLHLAVSDNGRGIPENEMKDVVRFGVRGSNTRPNETKGGGCGLTKAWWVAQTFGGKMWVESELGQGTTIRLFLPKR